MWREDLFNFFIASMIILIIAIMAYFFKVCCIIKIKELQQIDENRQVYINSLIER